MLAARFPKAARTAMPRFVAVAIAAVALPLAAGAQTVLNACGPLAAGSYVVGQDIAASGDCFVVGANFVTVDLGGFALAGDGTGGGITDGGTGREGIVVRNGGVTGFAVGINLDASPAAHVSGVTVTKNVGGDPQVECNAVGSQFKVSGIATGSGGIVTDSIARGNGGIGIKTGSASRVADNVAIDNDGIGFCAFSSSTVTGNTARRNGLDGLRTGSGSTVTGNTARENTGDGLVANSGSTVIGNTAKDNTGTGLVVSCPSLVRYNTAIDNGRNLDLVRSDGRCDAVDNLAPSGKKHRHHDHDD